MDLVFKLGMYGIVGGLCIAFLFALFGFREGIGFGLFVCFGSYLVLAVISVAHVTDTSKWQLRICDKKVCVDSEVTTRKECKHGMELGQAQYPQYKFYCSQIDE